MPSAAAAPLPLLPRCPSEAPGVRPSSLGSRSQWLKLCRLVSALQHRHPYLTIQKKTNNNKKNSHLTAKGRSTLWQWEDFIRVLRSGNTQQNPRASHPAEGKSEQRRASVTMRVLCRNLLRACVSSVAAACLNGVAAKA